MDPVQLSRTMSHALRHDPGHYGLTLDAEGWTTVDDLPAGLSRRGNDDTWLADPVPPRHVSRPR